MGLLLFLFIFTATFSLTFVFHESVLHETKENKEAAKSALRLVPFCFLNQISLCFSIFERLVKKNNIHFISFMSIKVSIFFYVI